MIYCYSFLCINKQFSVPFLTSLVLIFSSLDCIHHTIYHLQIITLFDFNRHFFYAQIPLHDLKPIECTFWRYIEKYTFLSCQIYYTDYRYYDWTHEKATADFWNVGNIFSGPRQSRTQVISVLYIIYMGQDKFLVSDCSW